jgi:hypothetical protein
LFSDASASLAAAVAARARARRMASSGEPAEVEDPGKLIAVLGDGACSRRRHAALNACARRTRALAQRRLRSCRDVAPLRR